MRRYAVVGFGCAGYHAVKAIRESGDNSNIDVYESTAKPPANPMLTTYYASDRISVHDAFPFGDLMTIKERYRLNIISSTHVKRIHLKERAVQTSEGTFHYDKILISTGAKAVLPSVKGLPDDRVFVMRTMEHAARLKEYLKDHKVKHAVVVGASMAGIKLVELFHEREIQTTIVDLADSLFPLAAYENVGKELERRLKLEGILFRLGTSVSEITKQGILIGNQEEIRGDVICFCIGTRANLDMVANLDAVRDTDLLINRAIVVNSHMETNISGIYAAGDCCEGIDLQTGETRMIGLWANAAYQGETAGRNMAGFQTEYEGNVVHNITHYINMDFIGIGDIRRTGDRIRFGNIKGELYIQAIMDGNIMQSVNILGGKQISGIIKSLFLKQLKGDGSGLSEVQKGILMKYGVDGEFISQLGG